MKLHYLLFFFTTFAIAQPDPHAYSKQIKETFKQGDTIKKPLNKVIFLSGTAGRMRYDQESKVLIDAAIKIANNAKDDESRANALSALGNYYFFNGKLDSALIYTKKASILSKDTDAILHSSSLMTLSGIVGKRGDNIKALTYLFNAQKVLDDIKVYKLSSSSKIKYKGNQLVLNNTLANYYNELGAFEKATSYYDKAISASSSLKDTLTSAILISNKGDLILNQGKYNEALAAFNTAYDLKVKSKASERSIKSTQLLIAKTYIELGNHKAADSLLKEAIRFFEKEDNGIKLSEAYTYKGELLLNENNATESIAYCEKAKAIAQQMNDLNLLSKSCQCLSSAYQKTNDYKNAFVNQAIYEKAKDSLFNEEVIKKQTEQELNYQFNKEKLIKDAQINTAEKKRKLFLNLSIIAMALALFIGYLLYKRSVTNKTLARQKILLEKTIDQKNILLKETHHRVKNSFQMVSSLLYIQSETTEQEAAQAALKEAQNRVRSMVLTHQKLYKTDNLIGIDTQEYITDLTKDVVESYAHHRNIVYKITAQSHILNVDTITPLGIIINELLTNCFKHAFTSATKEPAIFVDFKKTAHSFVLEIRDNGIGISTVRRNGALGLELLESLAEKLNGSLNIEKDTSGGTSAIVKFQEYTLLKE